MRCAVCQSENRAERRFCRECGAGLVPQACSECGFENYSGERFCGGCGIGIEVGAKARTSTTVGPAPTPAVPAVGEAQRRQVTVMFCDLVGSTALSEALDAEDLRDVINEFQATCAREIERHGGFVARYMGDGMLVYFGYPRAQEDSAQRAVRAGLRVLSAVAKLPREPAPRSVRIGIATGSVVIGDLIGAGASEERAVVGETPNLAARLQAVARPDTVVISDRTRRLAGDEFDLVDLGPQSLKGFADPVPAWQAIRERHGHGEGMRADVPMVGREFELALLADRWKAVKAGEGRAVVLTGDGGSGKTRLISEALARARVPAACALLFRCRRHRGDAGLHPVIEQISRALGLDVDDDGATRRTKVLDWVRTWSSDLEKDVPAIAALMSLPLGDGADLAGSPGEQRAEMLAALWRSLERKVEAGPLWVAFEDVQWADAATLDLVGALLERAVGMNLMVTVTHRTSFEAPWSRGAQLTSLSIGRLPPEDAASLVATVAEDDALPDAIVDQIVHRSDGVPAFLVELTRAVIASKDDAAGDAAFELVVPETLQDSLAAQLDRLDAKTREIAQVAAVIGREFSRNLLRRVYGGTTTQLDEGLGALVGAGLVVPPGLDQGSLYTFRHALLRDVALQSLLRRAQKRLHDRIGTVLVTDLPAAAQADPEGTAWHLDEAGRGREAASWWARAGRREAQRAAPAEAVRLYRRAVASLDHEADDDEATKTLAGLHCTIASQLRLVGRYDDALAELEQAQRLAEQHDMAELLSEIWHTRGNVFFRTGNVDGCLAAHEQALQEARRAGSIEAELRALGGIGDGTMARGNFADARTPVLRCVDLAEEHGFFHIAAPNAGISVYILGACLDNDLARAMAKRTERLARLAKDDRALAMAIQAEAELAINLGNADEAEAILNRLTEEGLEPEPFLRRFRTRTEAKILRARGRRAEGDARLREILPSLQFETRLRQLPTLVAAAGTGSDGEYQAALAEFLELFSVRRESHTGHIGLMEAMDVAIYRRDFDMLTRVLAVTEIQMMPGWFPALELWVDAVKLLLAWNQDRSNEDLRGDLSVITERAREVGQSPLADLLRDVMAEHDRTLAASG